MKKAVIGALAGILGTAVVAVYSASTTDAEVLQEMRDRAQIEDLMWRYTRALDTNTGEAYWLDQALEIFGIVRLGGQLYADGKRIDREYFRGGQAPLDQGP